MVFYKPPIVLSNPKRPPTLDLGSPANVFEIGLNRPAIVEAMTSHVVRCIGDVPVFWKPVN